MSPARGTLAALLFASFAFGHGQELRRSLSKEEEQRRFHTPEVRGMDAATRMRAYEQRQRMEAASPFGGLRWRNVGPETQGGRVIDIEAPLGNPDRVYVAFATGGLWVTEDEGATWESLFDDQSAFGIGAIALSRDGKTVWVGTGEVNSQRTSYSGTGVFKSTDGGKTWRNVGLPESHHIGRVLIDPKHEDTVYVAVMGHLYSQNAERGVYKTTDGGRTWSQVLKVDARTGAVDLAMDPRNPRVLYASMWDRDRRAWNFRESGPGSAVYRSADGGRTWTKLTALPTGTAAGRTGLAISPSHPDTVYAFVDNQAVDPAWGELDERVPSGRLTPRRFLLLNEEQFLALDRSVVESFLRRYGSDLKASDILEQMKAKKLTMRGLRDMIEKLDPNAFEPELVNAELYRTDDAGKSWRRVTQFGPHGGYYWGRVHVSPANPDDVYTMGMLLLHSRDGGKTWVRSAQEAHVDFHALWHDPRDPRRVWVGCDGGIYLSPDGGKSVRHINSLPVGQATTLALDMKRPYNIYLGFQDNGTMRGPSNYRPGRSNPNDWTTLFGGDGSHIAVDPREGGDVVYIAYQFGAHFGRNQKTNETWPARAEAAKGEPPARYNWISPLVVSSHHADILYLGSQRLYRSFNMGRAWQPISPDLTKDRPQGDVPHSTIKDIAESPLRFGLIYVGTDDGNVKMTPDGGYQWIDIKTPQPDKWVSRVVASKWDVATVYVAQSGYREDDFSAYLWRSTDYGKTWTSIVGDLPAETINVIREDPNRKDLLYVGTDMGVFVSFDGGRHWETLHGGMPNLPVHDLAVHPREEELVAATHARSAYVLPLKTLYTLTPELRRADLTLFDLDDVRRLPTWGYDRRERWDVRPPEPPKLTGSFYTREPGKATVRIKDKEGKVVKERIFDAVRGFNTFDIDLELAPGNPAAPAVPDPKDPLKDPREASRPTYIAVGEYTVELVINGKTVTKPWKVTR